MTSWWLLVCSEEQSPLPGPLGEHGVIAYHVGAFFVRGAVDKLAPSVREMGWMLLSHSFSQHVPAHFSGTHLLFCLLILLWRWEILCFPLEKISFHFLQTVPAAVPPLSVLNIPWKLLPRHFLPCNLLLKPLPSFSRKAESTALGLSPLVTGPSSLASLPLFWCFF